MKVVIDIPEVAYEAYKEWNKNKVATVEQSIIADGTPLPEGKWIKACVNKREFWFCKKCEYPLFNEPKTNVCPNCGEVMLNETDK